jgi:hypothetical protein
MIFLALKAFKLSIVIFWIVTSCRFVGRYHTNVSKQHTASIFSSIFLRNVSMLPTLKSTWRRNPEDCHGQQNTVCMTCKISTLLPSRHWPHGSRSQCSTYVRACNKLITQLIPIAAWSELLGSTACFTPHHGNNYCVSPWPKAGDPLPSNQVALLCDAAHSSFEITQCHSQPCGPAEV